jgi:hypothetical protein
MVADALVASHTCSRPLSRPAATKPRDRTHAALAIRDASGVIVTSGRSVTESRNESRASEYVNTTRTNLIGCKTFVGTLSIGKRRRIGLRERHGEHLLDLVRRHPHRRQLIDLISDDRTCIVTDEARQLFVARDGRRLLYSKSLRRPLFFGLCSSPSTFAAQARMDWYKHISCRYAGTMGSCPSKLRAFSR